MRPLEPQCLLADFQFACAEARLAVVHLAIAALVGFAILTAGLARCVAPEVARSAEPRLDAHRPIAVAVRLPASARVAFAALLLALLSVFAVFAGIADSCVLSAFAIATTIVALLLTPRAEEAVLAGLAGAVACTDLVHAVLWAGLVAHVPSLAWWALCAAASLAVADRLSHLKDAGKRGRNRVASSSACAVRAFALTVDSVVAWSAVEAHTRLGVAAVGAVVAEAGIQAQGAEVALGTGSGACAGELLAMGGPAVRAAFLFALVAPEARLATFVAGARLPVAPAGAAVVWAGLVTLGAEPAVLTPVAVAFLVGALVGAAVVGALALAVLLRAHEEASWALVAFTGLAVAVRLASAFASRARLVALVSEPAGCTLAGASVAVAPVVLAVRGRARLVTLLPPESVVAAISALARRGARAEVGVLALPVLRDLAAGVALLVALAVSASVAVLAVARAVHVAGRGAAMLAARLVALVAIETVLARQAGAIELVARALATLGAHALAVREPEEARGTAMAFAVDIALLISAVLGALAVALQARCRVLLGPPASLALAAVALVIAALAVRLLWSLFAVARGPAAWSPLRLIFAGDAGPTQ